MAFHCTHNSSQTLISNHLFVLIENLHSCSILYGNHAIIRYHMLSLGISIHTKTNNTWNFCDSYV